MCEHLDPQRMQQPLGAATHHARLGPHHPPVEQGDTEEHEGRDPQRVWCVLRDAVVEPVAHEQGPGQRAQRVERHEEHPDEQPPAVAPQETEERELGRRPGFDSDVDLRIGVRRLERIDLGEQLGRRRECAAPRCAARRPAAPAARRTSEAHRSGARGTGAIDDQRAPQLVVSETVPRRRRDPVDAGVVLDPLLHGVDSLRVVARARQEHPVQVTARGQLFVRSRVDHLPVVDDHDPIGERQGRATVRDEQRRSGARDSAQGGVDLVLDAGIDGRRGVVEEQDLGVGQQGARERHALPLTTREGQTLLADDGVIAVRELHDELVRFGGAGCSLDLGRRGVGPPERDVRGDRIGEEERVLEHDADAASQRLQRRVAHVDAVDGHRARMHVVEPGQQEPDGRLARARAAHERDRLAGRDMQAEVAQHRFGRCVAEGHAVEGDRAAFDVQLTRVGMILDEWGRVEQVVDALGARARQLADRQDRRQLSDGRRDEQHVRREREERAVRDVVVQREPSAEREHGHLTEGRDRLHRRLEPSLDVH